MHCLSKCTCVLLAAALIATAWGEEAEAAEEGKTSGRGFGDNYDWWKIDAGIRTAEATGKPAMVVVHKSWCGACRHLGPVFANASEVHELAKDFVMINVYDDDEKGDDPRWQPEGQYIPRIIFYDGLHGEVLKQINEQGNPKFKYFYMEPKQIADSMTKVKELFQTDVYKSAPADKPEL